MLLSRENLGKRHHYTNALNTFRELLRLGVIPIVNENDTVRECCSRCCRCVRSCACIGVRFSVAAARTLWSPSAAAAEWAESDHPARRLLPAVLTALWLCFFELTQVAVEELRFGDNDTLSALVASLVRVNAALRTWLVQAVELC